jgi:hypothetical protein
MSNRDWTLESEWQRWGFTAQPRSPPQ